MIQANELRIGNKVIYSNSNSFYTVTGIYEYGIDVEDEIEQTYMEYENFEPIELTKEILLKCGFDKIREYFQIDWFVIYKDEKGYYAHINCGNNYIKSLHQLQNLYFALTNEELDIKL